MADRFLVKTYKTGFKTPVTEGMKKKIERDQTLAKVKKEFLSAKKKEQESLNTIAIEKAFAYAKEYQEKTSQEIDAAREAKKLGIFYKKSESSLIFIVRIRGINKLPPKPRLILKLFRLRQIHNGVFIKLNKATNEMLKYIQPYVTYGTPSLSMIKQLCYKRGYARVGPTGSKQRIKISTNEIIKENLGKYGIDCMEDVIHEIFTCGPYFKQVTNFLWPFKLNSPRKGFIAKRHGFNEAKGGDWGNRETLINKLLARMV